MNYKNIVFGSVYVLLVLFGVYLLKDDVALGSVARGSEYQATTTDSTWTGIEKLITTGPGTLGSVIITDATTGTLTFFDATTTDITKRNNVPTTTIAIIAASASEAAYPFDVHYNYGLIVTFSAGAASSTITFRE